jgi:hypothetical protein
MSEALVSIAGNRVAKLRLNVANMGPWHAECDMEEAPALSGPVQLNIGGLLLLGSVVAQSDGTFGNQRKLRIAAGGGGWGLTVKAKGYHNDAGVKAREVALDLARAVGEQIGTFVPAVERLGADFASSQANAATVLRRVIGDNVAWWVDYNGVTNVGPRSTAALASTDYEVLAFDPRSRIATLAVDNPLAVSVGSIISERLDAPQTVRDFELRIDGSEMRVMAWCGGSAVEAGRLAELMRIIARQSNAGRIYGKTRYRVVGMGGDGRVNLQAVRKAAGLPDMTSVSQWPGVAGTHAELTPGAEVLVEFVEGDPSMPIVTHYAGKGGTGFVPAHLVIGGDAGSPAARSGDAVEVLLPPAVFSGTISGSPASGVLTFPMNKTSGTITAGSGKVDIAS